MTEDLAARLAELDAERLRVIGRTSSARFDLRADPAPSVAAALEADYLVDGSAGLDSGGRRSVSVRVIRARDGAVVWSGGVDERTDDDPSPQARLARSLAVALAPSIRVRADGRGARTEPAPAVRVEWLMAGRLLRREGPYDLERSLTLLHEVVAGDPEFGPAHVALGQAFARLGRVAEARAALAVGRAFEGASAGAAEVDGLLALRAWDVIAARAHLEEAAGAQPGDGRLLHTLAYAYALAADHDRAAATMERVRAVDPLSGAVHGDAGRFDLWAGRPRRAIEHCERVLSVVEPVYAVRAQRCLLEGRLAAGDSAGARAEAVRVLRAVEAPAAVIAAVAEADARTGLRRYFDWGAREDNHAHTEGSRSEYGRARALVAAGEFEASMVALRAALAAREPRLVQLPVDRRFSALRGLPGFRAIERAVLAARSGGPPR